jgi:hypothetical protein
MTSYDVLFLFSETSPTRETPPPFYLPYSRSTQAHVCFSQRLTGKSLLVATQETGHKQARQIAILHLQQFLTAH